MDPSKATLAITKESNRNLRATTKGVETRPVLTTSPRLRTTRADPTPSSSNEEETPKTPKTKVAAAAGAEAAAQEPRRKTPRSRTEDVS